MIDVFIEVEVVTSEENPNSTVKKRARVARSEDICAAPDSCGKVDIIIGEGDEAISIRADSAQLVKVLDFVQCTKEPVEETNKFSGGW